MSSQNLKDVQLFNVLINVNVSFINVKYTFPITLKVSTDYILVVLQLSRFVEIFNRGKRTVVSRRSKFTSFSGKDQ